MIPAELLRKKRDGVEWTGDEVRDFIHGLSTGAVNDAQAAAFLMAACTRGMSAAETAALSLSMRDSGDHYDFHDLGLPLIDKHSTGGVGDKLSLLLVPLVAACGVAVPMMSGRGLGHTGGTVDKLESIPGLQMDFHSRELRSLLHEHGAFLIKATANVAPADAKLYALRDVTGTIESTSLITASILSKKLVEGLDGLVLDMKVGAGAFMQTMDQARELAQSMLDVARAASLPMRIVFTQMDHPLGSCVGNWLEMQESENCLAHYDNCAPDIRELCEILGARMLMLADSTLTDDDARTRVRSVWQSGDAYRRFHALIAAQGGDWSEAERRYAHPKVMVLTSPRSGVLHSWSTRAMGIAAIELGAGRKKQDDMIDPMAGFRLLKRVGEEVKAGEDILILQAGTDTRLEAVRRMLEQGLVIKDEAAAPTRLILDEWSS